MDSWSIRFSFLFFKDVPNPLMTMMSIVFFLIYSHNLVFSVRTLFAPGNNSCWSNIYPSDTLPWSKCGRNYSVYWIFKLKMFAYRGNSNPILVIHWQCNTIFYFCVSHSSHIFVCIPGHQWCNNSMYQCLYSTTNFLCAILPFHIHVCILHQWWYDQ